MIIEHVMSTEKMVSVASTKVTMKNCMIIDGAVRSVCCGRGLFVLK